MREISEPKTSLIDVRSANRYFTPSCLYPSQIVFGYLSILNQNLYFLTFLVIRDLGKLAKKKTGKKLAKLYQPEKKTGKIQKIKGKKLAMLN